MKLPNCKAKPVLSALALLKLGTAIAANTAFLYYIPNFGTVAVSQFYRHLESNSVCDPNPSDPEPPARGKTEGSRMHTSLVKFGQSSNIALA